MKYPEPHPAHQKCQWTPAHQDAYQDPAYLGDGENGTLKHSKKAEKKVRFEEDVRRKREDSVMHCESCTCNDRKKRKYGTSTGERDDPDLPAM